MKLLVGAVRPLLIVVLLCGVCTCLAMTLFVWRSSGDSESTALELMAECPKCATINFCPTNATYAVCKKCDHVFSVKSKMSAESPPSAPSDSP